ncbi:hypothetical protein ACSSS7_005491 [Eimeria intestinalis]
MSNPEDAAAAEGPSDGSTAVLGFEKGSSARGASEEAWNKLLHSWSRCKTDASAPGARGSGGLELDVAAATAFQRSVPDEILQRPRQLQQERQGQPAGSPGSSFGREPPGLVSAASIGAAEAARGNAQAPMLRLYGVTASGSSVMCNVHGFYPYCYCVCPPALASAIRAVATPNSDGWRQNAVTDTLRALIDDHVSRTHAQGKGYERRIVDVRCEEKESLMHFSPSKAGQLFFRITAASPQMIACIRTLIESGIRLPIPEGFGSASGQQLVLPQTAYEANIPFVLRYMVDSEITGCCWIRGEDALRRQHGREARGCRQVSDQPSALAVGLRSSARTPWEPSMGSWSNKGRFVARPASLRESRCQEEYDVHYADLAALPLQGEWQSLPALRMLSFGEALPASCFSRMRIAHLTSSHSIGGSEVEGLSLVRDARGVGCTQSLAQLQKSQPFRSKEDPVIQISSIVQEHRQDGSDVHNKSSDATDEPLCRVIFTLHECAPIAGAIVIWFDDEAEMLRKWAEFVREVDPDFLTGYNCINFDLCYLLTRASALKVDGVAFLSRLKSVESRITDTRFSSRALGTHDNKEITVEGRVQFDLLELVRRDHKLKSYSLNYVSSEFLKEQKRAGGDRDDKYEGATVLEPVKGFYDTPIATLDFASLYPSIMMAHNICYSTLVKGNDINSIDPAQQFRLPSQSLSSVLTTRLHQFLKHFTKPANWQLLSLFLGEPERGAEVQLWLIPVCVLTQLTHTSSNPRHTFVKATIRRGVLPMIVEELIAARKIAKKQMSQATDKFTQSVLNGRQLALKITANSVYGYTGATVGQLPCLEVATSITCFGRDMIEYTKRRVEELYTRENGYETNALVVYGDTDSVMVRFGTDSIEEAMRLGEEAANRISSEFVSPIRLEFEKVYCPFLLMNKKRYAGLLYTSPTKFDRIDSKGIETVRRDFSLLVQIMVDTVLKKMLIDRDVENAKAYTRSKIAELLQVCRRQSLRTAAQALIAYLCLPTAMLDIACLTMTNFSSIVARRLLASKFLIVPQNKIDLSLLVQTKSLGKLDYDTKLPHVELAKKLRKRDPGTAPNVGDRVSYVVIQGSKGQAQYERAEDPLYVLENNLPIDTQHYLETLKGPLMRIFEGVMSNPESLFSTSVYKVFPKSRAQLFFETGANASPKCTRYRRLSPLSGGGHTLKKTLMVSTQGALSKFIKRGIQCVGCRATLCEGALCKHCQSKEGQMAVLEKEHGDLWTECQRCVPLTAPSVCASR